MNPNRSIREIMTEGLVSVAPDTTARQIKELFDENDFHHLPVITGKDKLVGIISKQDFYRLAYFMSLQTTGRTWSEKAYEALYAKDFMTEHPLTLEPEDTIGLAADIFLANQFHAIPVVEDGHLIGLVTTHDLLMYSFKAPISEEWT